MNNEINTFDYSPEMQPWFEKLNRAWIEKYFFIEPQDNIVLGHPDEAFLRGGGAVLMASLNNHVAGAVALKNAGERTFELAKMGVDEKYHGKGLGTALINAAIRKAKALGAERLVLYSNTKLEAAIHLYRKFGFREVVLEEGRLARCNIKMELRIQRIAIMKAVPEQAYIIAAIGRESFKDAFADFFNKKEDLDRYISHTYDPEKIAVSIRKPNNVFFIAYYDEEPAGFVKLKKPSLNKHIPSPQQTELQKIYILKKFHGKDVADLLLAEVMTVATEAGADHLWLDVIVENARAIRFYQKNGFTRCGDHSFVIGSQTFYYDVMSVPVSKASRNRHKMSDVI